MEFDASYPNIADVDPERKTIYQPRRNAGNEKAKSSGSDSRDPRLFAANSFPVEALLPAHSPVISFGLPVGSIPLKIASRDQQKL